MRRLYSLVNILYNSINYTYQNVYIFTHLFGNKKNKNLLTTFRDVGYLIWK